MTVPRPRFARILAYTLGHLGAVAASLVLTAVCASVFAVTISAHAILVGYFILTFIWGFANGIISGASRLRLFSAGLLVSSAILAGAIAWFSWSGIASEFGKARDVGSFVSFMAAMRMNELGVLVGTLGLGVITGLSGLISGSWIRRTVSVEAVGGN
jgi:hypothetical protein